MKDKWNRTINYMRISVTDQCNLRCCYCMPEEGVKFLNQTKLLTFDEMETIVKAGAKLGINRIKITGGEPLIRSNLTDFIKRIKLISGIEQVTLTTNGVLLKKYAKKLKEAQIDSININFPAVTKEKYKAITRRDEFENVLEGIKVASELGIHLKINCVSRKTILDDELLEYIKIAKEAKLDVRFIEMMPLGHGKMYETYSNEKILNRLNYLLRNQHEENTSVSNLELKLSPYKGNGPAIYYEAENLKGKIGFISAVSHKFCNECNRIRLSADGNLKLCLNYEKGVSLKNILRFGEEKKLLEIMEQVIYDKPKEHCFYEKSDLEMERKNMVQIGG